MHRGRDDYDYERLLKRHKEERMRGDRYESGRDARYEQEYTSICLNGLNPTVPMHILKDEIYRQFSKFGDLTIRVISSNPENRIAFCNFYESEAAREAKRARKNLILFDVPVHIEAVYNRRHRSPSPNGYSKQGYNSRTSPGSGRHTHDGYSEGYSDGYYDDNKKGRDHHKFPYHLNHVQPEDDPYANRTLFVGNVDVDITEIDIRSIFERYGVIEEIDIKRPQKPGLGNAYAFIKYYNVDMAHRAKVDMSGRYIGRYQCKIGYGKPTATNCLWIGGLGPWVRADILEQEFDRFGVINRIEWPHGKGYAYVLFDSVDAAQAANSAMRGAPLGGPEHRIRVDYADESHMPSHSKSPRLSSQCEETKKSDRGYQDERKHREDYRDRTSRSERDYNPNSEYRNPDNPEMDRHRKDEYDRVSVASDRRRQSGKSYDDDRNYRNYQSRERVRNSREQDTEREANKFSPEIKRRRTASPISVRSREEKERFSESEQRERKRTTSSGSGALPINVESTTNIDELAKCLHVVWNGALVLKNSAFAARMHLVSGDVHLVDTLMRDTSSTEMPVLKITQRLRLDLPKLEEVGRRVATSGTNGHAVLLAMPGSSDSVEESNTSSSSVQQRPLRNLISYLKQKEAAGVISLPPNPSKDKDNIGVLHAFPPCAFGNDFLNKRAPKLTCDLTKDDHLVIIVVRGAV